jgi:hypothetical protein
MFSPPLEITARYDADCLSRSICSNWIVMNLFDMSPNVFVIDLDQTTLIRPLQKRALDSIRQKPQHSNLLIGESRYIILYVHLSVTLQRCFH